MRTRVETVIGELGYRPRIAARALRGSSFTSGFEIPHLEYFYNQVIEGAATSLAGSEYQLIVAPGLRYLSGTSVLNALVDRQVDGIIAIASEVTPDWLDQLAEQIPMVLLGRHDHSQRYDTLTNDDVAGTDLIMDHLLGLGHRQIAHLTIRPPTELSPHAMRLGEYRHRMEQAGFEPQVVYSQATESDAYETARTLLVQSRPTAIFAGHDTLAIGALRALGDAGLDGADVSVVGYDNVDLAGHPLISLTTVDQFGIEMGVAAIELLMERIRDGRTSPKYHQLDPHLRIRSSSRPVSTTARVLQGDPPMTIETS
jgi:LacI family transcriptional regulator